MTYTIATKTVTESGTVVAPIQGLPLMTILQARKACDMARSNGHDVVIFNVNAE